MGTIIERPKKDGSVSYTAQVRLKSKGRTVFSEARTFGKEKQAKDWIKRMEKALASSDAAAFAARNATVASVIERYLGDAHRKIGKTKEQCLRAIAAMDFGSLRASEARETEIIDLMATLCKTMKPQTVANYIAHLSSVYTVAKPAYRVELLADEMQRAKAVGRSMGYLAKSKRRTRRPTRDEMDKIMAHFVESAKRTDAMPMHKLSAFAMSSSRRQDEICRILWSDLDVSGSRVLVRDMKHPGEKDGNDVWVDLPAESLRVILSMPKVDPRIFPFDAGSVSTAFTRAATFLKISDLHFHDLRHEATSRLFEMDCNIPQAKQVTGHRTWASLERYTHVRQRGDIWAGWSGWDLAAEPETPDRIEALKVRLLSKAARSKTKVRAARRAI